VEEGVMEEPAPCPGCGDIVELQDMRKCRRCRDIFCRECLDSQKECAVCCERTDTRAGRKV
jgi:hypothetical protein